MKALIVYSQMNGNLTGGVQGHKRSVACLQHFFGENNIYEYPVIRKDGRFLLYKIIGSLISLNFLGLDNQDKKHIYEIIKKEKIDLIYVDTSFFGSLIKFIKSRCDVKIVSFFHNVEYDFQKSQMNFLKKFLLGWQLPLVKKSESITLKCSDSCIALHHKDNERLKELYGTSAGFEAPVALMNSPVIYSQISEYHRPLRLLFFGSYFPSNVEAVNVLLNKIRPNVSACFRIAGSGMDVLSNRYNNDNVIIEGFVENIQEMYDWADVIVLPIYSGAGMKVKVAEALQYGKNIIASKDALIGYEIDGVDGVISCDTVQDLVDAINNFDITLPRYNQKARKLFEERYSYDASYKIFDKVFSKTLDKQNK